MGVIRQLLDKKTLKILDLLLKNKDKIFHLSTISNDSKVPIASTFRIINHLVSLGIVEFTVVGKMKIYKIASNEKIMELDNVLKIKNEN